MTRSDRDSQLWTENNIMPQHDKAASGTAILPVWETQRLLAAILLQWFTQQKVLGFEFKPSLVRGTIAENYNAHDLKDCCSTKPSHADCLRHACAAMHEASLHSCRGLISSRSLAKYRSQLAKPVQADWTMERMSFPPMSMPHTIHSLTVLLISLQGQRQDSHLTV